MTEEIREEKLAELEAVLFLQGEPLSRGKIVKILGVQAEELAELVGIFEERLEAADRGLALVSNESDVQLVTKPRFHEFVGQFVKEEFDEELSEASVETLSLVAYLGSITKIRIEYLRGVNSSFILRSLLLRGLIDRIPDPSEPHGYLYRASAATIRHLGIEKQQSLPDYEKFQQLKPAITEETP